MPAVTKEIEAGLRSRGLTSGLFRLEAVIKAAELLGKGLPLSITEVNGERVVHCSAPAEHPVSGYDHSHRAAANLSLGNGNAIQCCGRGA